MKKILVILLVLAMTFMMAACDGGSAEASDEDMVDYPGWTEPIEDQEEMTGGFNSSSGSIGTSKNSNESKDYLEDPESAETEDSGQGAGLGLPKSIDKKSVKIIYTANIHVQTLDFDEAVGGLNDLVEKYEGYFESTNIDNGNYYSDDNSYRYGSYTVRVPSKNFQKFIASVNEGMHVVNMNQEAQDIGQQYFDTERRLETLKNKHDRLEALLKEAKKMSDIIELESALSETEYEIDSYSSEISRYDSLVDYSTINIDIEKVSDYSVGIQDELTFGQRLLRSVTEGFSGFVIALGSFLEWVGYNLIQIAIIVVAVIVCRKKHLIRKIKGALSKKRAPKDLDKNDKDK